MDAPDKLSILTFVGTDDMCIKLQIPCWQN